MNHLEDPSEPCLRTEYARYFFSLFDACLHDDAHGQRQAQAHLEEALTRVGPLTAPELA
jgi:hypothetical protein